jgi:eukaryotic-like serine/threonine-protein kinase
MDSARYAQIESLFHHALERPDGERHAFLETACGNDAVLMAEVLAMLDADSRRASLLDRGLPDVAYQMIGAPFDLPSSHEFGPYRLKRLLGEGGMGVVWLAERKDAGNLVAIKFLPHAGLSPARRERFIREIKTLAKLKHPYIARLYDAGTLSDGTPWFVMEYVDGVRLTEYCRSVQRPIEEELRLFRKICQAVQYAHGQEIIHRDLKPSNILVEQDGTPRLLDFGIARELQNTDEQAEQTRPGLRFLSPDYAAPEWARDGTVGFYTDVYSLGVMLYEMLSGHLPVVKTSDEGREGPSLAGEQMSLLSKPARSDLDTLCRKAMRPDPQERYQSVEALIRDIDHYLNAEPLDARQHTLRYQLGKFVVRNRRAVLAGAMSVALIAGLVVFFALRLAKERGIANRESAIVAAMNQFLTDDLLGQTNPFISGQAQESFVDIVNQASSHIDRQFRSEPVVAGRLHRTIAVALDNRSDFPLARREYVRAAELFNQGEGPLSPDGIVVRLQRAAMEARTYERGSLDLAKQLLREAEVAISRTAKPRDDLPVWILNTRATIALVDNDPRSANADFREALDRAQAVPSFDAAALRRLRRTLAFSYIRMGDGAKAESLLRDIIAELSSIDGPESPNALQARINFSQSLLIQGKFAEAIKEANLIYPTLVQKLGEDHETTLAVLGTRAASEGSLGMWDEAIRDDLTVYNIQVRKRGPITYQSIGMLSDAALSQCQAGRYQVGEANARKVFQVARQAFGPRAGLTGGTAYALAVCLIGEDKLDEASGLLGNIDVQAVSGMTGDSTVGAAIALAQGQIAARRGDYISAQRYVQAAAPALERPNAAIADKRSLQALKSEVDAHLGQSR